MMKERMKDEDWKKLLKVIQLSSFILHPFNYADHFPWNWDFCRCTDDRLPVLDLQLR